MADNDRKYEVTYPDGQTRIEQDVLVNRACTKYRILTWGDETKIVPFSKVTVVGRDKGFFDGRTRALPVPKGWSRL